MKFESVSLQTSDAKIEETQFSNLAGRINAIVISLGRKHKSADKVLVCFCNELSSLFSENFLLSVRVTFENFICQSKKFIESDSFFRNQFSVPGQKEGKIEVFISGNTNSAKSIISELKRVVKDLIPTLVGAVSVFYLEKMIACNTERVKELESINQTTEIIKKSSTLGYCSRVCVLVCQEQCNILIILWQG